VKKEFLIPSEIARVQSVSAEALEYLKSSSLSENIMFDIRLCLEEALINAIKYGNKQKKELSVRLVIEVDDKEVRLTVEDQGEGFDPAQLKDCTSDENLLNNCGRGVYLMKQLMDTVRYNAKGNSVLMIKSRNSKKSPASAEK
jgi:serine/threonine-protein kinase RsbW